MEDSSAYQVGQIAGIIFVIMLLIGLCVFFIVALVKTIKTRRRGWLIAAIISGAPFLAMLVLFLIGMAIGFSQSASRLHEVSAAHRQAAVDLLKEPMTPVAGNGMAYEVSLPSIDRWTKKDSSLPFDYLFFYHDAYLGIIAENIGAGTSEKLCAISLKNLASKASTYSATEPAAADIDSHSWRTFDVSATITDLNIKYRFYVYADADRSIQIVAWSGPAVFEQYAPVFDRIAKSFKLPK